LYHDRPAYCKALTQGKRIQKNAKNGFYRSNAAPHFLHAFFLKSVPRYFPQEGHRQFHALKQMKAAITITWRTEALPFSIYPNRSGRFERTAMITSVQTVSETAIICRLRIFPKMREVFSESFLGIMAVFSITDRSIF
jgi:hypothetical protein